MKHKLFLLFGLLTSSMLFAQETKTLTLKEAITLSLKNNHILKLNEAKIASAKAYTQEALDRRLPDAGVTGSYIYLPINPKVDLKIGAGGGTPEIRQVMYTMLNSSLPLYAGGKIRYGIESAKYLEQATQLDAENDKMGVMLNTINGCINLYKAHQAIELVNENLTQSQQRLNDFTNLEKNGLLARNDLMKSKLQQSQIELAVLDAESNYKIACVNMNIMMGLPASTILIPDKSGLALPTILKSFEEYETLAFKNRNDVHAISIRKKVAELGVKNAESDKYPSVALTGGYVAANIPKLLTVYNAINLGVGIKYNIASLWKNKPHVEQAVANVTQIEQGELALDDKIKMQLNQAYQSYVVSIKKIEVYETAVLQATENYRITKNKHDNSLTTTTELLDADVSLLQSKLSVTNAKADSFLAYINLLYTAGLLTESN